MTIYDELRKKISANPKDGFRNIDAYIKSINDDHIAQQKLYFYLMDAKNPSMEIQVGRHPYDYVFASPAGADEGKYAPTIIEAKRIFGILSINFLQYFAKSELKFLKYSRISNKQEFSNTLKTLEQIVRFDERLNEEASGLRIRRVGGNDFDYEKIKRAFEMLKGLK